jgi:FtsP/CotA-like multicopper oxidase with cupredoxin domain
MEKRIFIAAILMFMTALPISAYAHGEETADEKGKGEEMSLRDMKNAAMMDSGDDIDFIRYDAPAGMSAVLGRENLLNVLEPEIIKEDGKTIKLFRLVAKDIEFEVYPGKKVSAFAFNGTVPGPTLRMTQGDRIRIIFTNEGKDEHTIHIHGQPKPLAMDGVPYLSQEPVKKGESFTYEFTVKNSGTHWYHCHVDSGHHVDMGMYGAFIVDPKREKLKFDREYTLILDEWPGGHVHEGGMSMGDHNGKDTRQMAAEDMAEPLQDSNMTGMAADGMAAEKKEPKMGMGMEGMAPMAKLADRDWYPKTYKPYIPVYDTFTINGRSFPYTQPLEVREGERVRIRLINTGYESHYMHSHSHKFAVVAKDGNPVPGKPQIRDTVEVSPGQRVDIILKADNPGVWPFHCHNLLHVANDNIYPGGMLTFIKYIE